MELLNYRSEHCNLGNFLEFFIVPKHREGRRLQYPTFLLVILLPSHEYLISRYLYVPPQGSPPKVLLLTSILHEFLPLHAAFTIESELSAIQFVFEVAACGQVALLVLPKLAHFTDNLWLLIGHFRSKVFPSHTILISVLVD